MFPCSVKPLGDLARLIYAGRGATGCEKRGIYMENSGSPWKMVCVEKGRICVKNIGSLRNIHFGFLLGLENI